MTANTVPDTTRVLVIDDHPLLRRGVCQLLALVEGFTVVGEAASGREGIELAKQLDPDLILLDLNMKGINGLETLRTMRDMGVDARIIMLTVSNAPEDLLAAIRAGSDGYILKDNDPDNILKMICDAMQGQNVISPELSSLLATALREESESESRNQASLTERETAILRCLAAGMSNKLIARELDIMESTVKVHVRNLFKKLKFRSRVEAAVWAIANETN
ncbi:MAG: two-component system response regulator NarL [Gammaproteobacteria bacterium]|nr:two-component system response regulator NarL [Gammaproteobacteria bacterium]MBU4004865.1 two-component system response regulator NarL [Gammaproteobacteria bacterium]MBU4020458.1 two-component system response regulator NarL [Gammaproteobacteria bacterium]MBU4095534.1 two-component system response regulator NarL [Gammaproteobacteria bacterium]MBU4146219.1 two-component system response regulator NarL [Gammaproteobacteria bacterium]